MFALIRRIFIFKNIYIVYYITANIFVVASPVQPIKEIVNCIFVPLGQRLLKQKHIISENLSTSLSEVSLKVNIFIISKKNLKKLFHLRLLFHFYIPWKLQKTLTFMTFSEGIEMVFWWFQGEWKRFLDIFRRHRNETLSWKGLVKLQHFISKFWFD